MRILIVRHGETEWNKEKRVMSRFDAPLNENGLLQAEEIRNKLLTEKIDLIICSPLKRARKTAEIINRNRNIPIIYEEGFIERNFGTLEGCPIESINFNEYWDYYKNLNDNNVETMKDMFDRVYKTLDKLIKEYNDKTILIVSHGGVGMPVDCYFNHNIPQGSLRELGLQLKNCELKEYNINE